MWLTVDRDADYQRTGDGSIFFQARDQDGAEVTLMISSSALASLEAEAASDPVGELEQLARSGHWERCGAGRVWRVTLI